MQGIKSVSAFVDLDEGAFVDGLVARGVQWIDVLAVGRGSEHGAHFGVIASCWHPRGSGLAALVSKSFFEQVKVQKGFLVDF